MAKVNIRTITFKPESKKPSFVPKALHGSALTTFADTFVVRKEDAGFILGTKGFKIKRIMRDSGAFVQLEHTVSGSNFFIQAMNPEAVKAALDLIHVEACKAFELNTGRKQKTQPKQHYQHTVPINSENAGLLIGKGGATCRGIKRALGLTGLRVDTKDGHTTLRLSGRDRETCLKALSQLQQDFTTVFFTAPPAPRKQQPPRPSTPPRPISPIDLYLPGGGADGPRTPQEFEPFTPPGTPPLSPNTQRKVEPPVAFFGVGFP